MAGMGTLGFEGCEFGFGQDVYDVNTTLELMQVVAPSGTGFCIKGTAGHAGRNWEFHMHVPPEYECPEPEPSTIVMLFVGSLCLLGVRIRK